MPTEVPITEPMPRHRPSQPAVQLSLFTWDNGAARHSFAAHRWLKFSSPDGDVDSKALQKRQHGVLRPVPFNYGSVGIGPGKPLLS